MPTEEAEPLCIGTKIGQCDICKATKKIYLLKFGFTLCEECLDICTMLLEQIQQIEENQQTTVDNPTFVKPKLA
jgi:deoxyxylulose-5-phosphate synthase